jgi:hypothetical protein
MMGGHDEAVIVVGVGRRRDPRDDVVIVRWSRRVRHEVVDLLLSRGGWAHRTRRQGRPGGKVLEKMLHSRFLKDATYRRKNVRFNFFLHL